MGKNIGVDFGTTNSIVSYIPQGGEPQEYENACVQSKYTTSAIRYSESETIIGQNAVRSFDQNSNLYHNFKMFLNTNSRTEWTFDKEPIEVAENYLYALLTSKENDCSFESSEDKIDGIALTVPAFWDEQQDNLGLANIKKILENLEMKNIRLLSEPQAAAAYYIWWYKEQHRKNFDGKLLVCDMGGGTFDVSLVFASKYHIDVLFNTGNGQEGLGAAGVAFDTEVLRRALQKATGEVFDKHNKEHVHLLQHFEQEKIRVFSERNKGIKEFEERIENNKGGNEPTTLFILNYSRDTIPITDDLLINTFEDKTLPHINQVLGKVKNYIQKHNERVDRIIIVGGFGRFILVKKAIFDALEIGQSSKKIDTFVGNNKGQYAIARGAALVAEGIVTVDERIKYDIGIYGRVNEGGNQQRQPLTLIKRGSLYSNNKNDVCFLQDYVVAVSEPDYPTKLDLFLLTEDNELISKLRHEKISGLEPHKEYELGMKIDKSKIIHLIFRNRENMEEYSVSFADILAEKGEVIARKIIK